MIISDSVTELADFLAFYSLLEGKLMNFLSIELLAMLSSFGESRSCKQITAFTIYTRKTPIWIKQSFEWMELVCSLSPRCLRRQQQGETWKVKTSALWGWTPIRGWRFFSSLQVTAFEPYKNWCARGFDLCAKRSIPGPFLIARGRQLGSSAARCQICQVAPMGPGFKCGTSSEKVQPVVENWNQWKKEKEP